jgi:hypothetical protein
MTSGSSLGNHGCVVVHCSGFHAGTVRAHVVSIVAHIVMIVVIVRHFIFCNQNNSVTKCKQQRFNFDLGETLGDMQLAYVYDFLEGRMANNYWKIGKMCEMWVKPKVTQQPGFPFSNKWGVRKVSSRGFQVKGNNFRSSCKHCAEEKKLHFLHKI